MDWDELFASIDRVLDESATDLRLLVYTAAFLRGVDVAVSTICEASTERPCAACGY